MRGTHARAPLVADRKHNPDIAVHGAPDALSRFRWHSDCVISGSPPALAKEIAMTTKSRPQQSRKNQQPINPRPGDRYHCDVCGLEIGVVAGCTCEGCATTF